MKFLKNKKGDIAITILVIGVFAVCTLAILSFLASEVSFSDSFIGVEVLENLNSDMDEYAFYRREGINSEKFFPIGDLNGQKYYVVEKKSKPLLFWQEEELVFSVKYPLG